MDNNLTYKKILSIKRIEKKQKVYNFNVPGYESYIANGFVVHNCENHVISQVEPLETKYYSPDVVVGIAEEKGCKSITMSYNEPSLSYEYMYDLAISTDIHDLDFIIKTNAFVNEEPWREMCLISSAMNIDWKGSEEKFKSITRVNHYVLQDRIREAVELGVHIEISFPLYYRDEELEEEMIIAGEFLSSLDKDIPCHLLSIQPSFEYSDFIFNPENMNRAKEILSRYMTNVYSVI